MWQRSFPVRSVLLALLMMVVSGLLAGCNEVQDNSPAAATPANIHIFYLPNPGGKFMERPPSPGGEYKIMPSKGFRLVFDAPWPLDVILKVNGTQLKRKSDFPSGTADTAMEAEGFFDFDIDLHSSEPARTPTWTYGVVLPASLQSSPLVTVSVHTVSINNTFTGLDKTSNPALIRLVKPFNSPGGTMGSNCPQITTMAGWSFFDNPKCDVNALGAVLACDSAGYFCCMPSTGSNSPRCGGIDKRDFPADCMYGNPKVQMFASGCYIRN